MVAPKSNLTFMGGVKVLLSSLVECALHVFLENDRSRWLLIFDSVKEWSKSEMQNHRVVWLRFVGVLVHI